MGKVIFDTVVIGCGVIGLSVARIKTKILYVDKTILARG